jgi:FKBP-type peptidyl-prolyl cis-trans isomerase FklB
MQAKVSLKDGTIIDEGFKTLSPHQVFKGWAEVILLMSEGDKWIAYIPYDLAYGEQGKGEVPPFSPIVLEVEVIQVRSTRGKTATEARSKFKDSLHPSHADEL